MKEKSMNALEKIARAFSSQKAWGQKMEEVRTNINILQGEINTRISDMIEIDSKLTPDSIMQQVQELLNPQQMPEKE